MEAYEARRPSYFSTPATSLVAALAASLEEILAFGVEERWEAHRRAAEKLRRAWAALGLESVPRRPEIAAHTLSALYFPEGTGSELLGRIKERGVVVAGGLHREIKERYFRVGHMGYSVTRPDHLRRTVAAVAGALAEVSSDAGIAVSTEEALAAFEG